MPTRIWHFGVCSVVVGDAAYGIRERRGIPLGFNVGLWLNGWRAWADGLGLTDAAALLGERGVGLGLFAMRPLGSTRDPSSGSSFRIDCAAEYERVAGRNSWVWLSDLRSAWPGPLVCGIGSQPRNFTRDQFLGWTAPFWRIGARVSFDACAGEAAGSPIHSMLTAPGIRENVLIESAPRRADTHWHGLPAFAMHRAFAANADRTPIAELPAGSIVRIEHRDHLPDGMGGWTGERTDEEVTATAIAALGANPGIGVALDTTRLSEPQLLRLAAAAHGPQGAVP